MKTQLVPITLFLILASSARAQVFELPPFVGAEREGFETQVAAGMTGWQDCLIGSAFESSMEICTPLGPHMHVNETWSDDCTATPRSGAYLAGTRTGSYTLLTFLTPADRFGGYFTVNAPALGTVTAYFYDSQFQTLGVHELDISNDCTWTWNGWESQGSPIYFMEIDHEFYSGGKVLFDDLTLDFPDDTIGTRFCDSAINSTGQPALMSATGTTSLLASDLHLSAFPVPPATSAIMFYGPEAIEVPFGQGTRCVGHDRQGIQRLMVTTSTGAGEVLVDLDYSVLSFLRITAGSTWYFQTWFSDPRTPFGAGLSDALELTFVP